MKNRLLFLIIPIILGISCQSPRYEKLSNGLLIHLNKGPENTPRIIKLQVLSENIIHVVASPDNTFSKDTSLIIIHDKSRTVEWQYSDEGDYLNIRTATLNIDISKETGEIVFKNTDGTVKLKEPVGGGKTFKPVEIDGDPFYSIHQVFESPDNEAFYGLGHHQNGQMNYKGDDVELAQHNIVVAVPFLYSNKNYGILWDNYSITRFGDPREYQPLSTLDLFSKNGESGGLTAQYYNSGKLLVNRPENKINYQYLDCLDDMPEEFSMRDGKVIWEGSIASNVEGMHKFLLYASGYFTLWIDDELIINDWRQDWNPWYDKFTLDMRQGEKHSIRLEWTPTGQAYIAFKHLDPVGEVEQNRLSLFSEVGHQINYYFINGSNADEVISGYREITGKAPIVPLWALGLWQSRERYRTQDEMLNVVREFRKRKIPLDNIVLDWFYWPEDKWGSHDFDPARFPDPAGMVDELHKELNTRIMISVWPKFYKGTDHFNEMLGKGFLYQRNLEKEVKDWVGYYSTFYDAFNPDARRLFWDQMNTKLNVLGIDAWWMDATEPEMESNNSIEERKLLMNPTYLGSGSQYFNAYSLMNAKGIYEGLREADPDKRIFILTRSAYAGQQRFAAATWSGDVASRWSVLRNQISGGINFCISGIPYWTTDIGGFSVERRYENASGEDLKEWREFMTRWFQFSTFCPLFRVHGQYPYREIFNVAPENHPAYQTMLYYDKLRYRLMPYIYSLAGKTYHEDYTIMRALIMDFSFDNNVFNIGDQYMFGPGLMVCPVYEYQAEERKVYLPSSSGWYDLYSGKYYEGGHEITARAPISKIPVFVKEGSVIPFGPEIQYTGEKPADPITVFVYTGKDASFTLYEDEGINYNYERGIYSTLTLDYKQNDRTLTIKDRQGQFPGMLAERTFKVVFILKDKPTGIGTKDPTYKTIKYNGGIQQISY